MTVPPNPAARDRAWASYSERFRTQVMPELLASKIFLAVLGDGDEVVRIQFATSLGMMLLRNRPIVLMALPGVLIPPKLRLIADVLIEDADMADPGTQERLADALRQVGLPDQE